MNLRIHLTGIQYEDDPISMFLQLQPLSYRETFRRQAFRLQGEQCSTRVVFDPYSFASGDVDDSARHPYDLSLLNRGEEPRVDIGVLIVGGSDTQKKESSMVLNFLHRPVISEARGCWGGTQEQRWTAGHVSSCV